MTLIDGDRIITAQLYDDEYEEFTEKKMSIIDYINAYTDEGVTTADVVEQTEWIPVSERLPEKNMACLVAVGKFNLTQIAIYSGLMGIIDHRIFYQGDVGHDNFKDITGYVKAWMPLPQTYKTESEE